MHRAFLPGLPPLAHALREAGVTLRADAEARALLGAELAELADDSDWGREYGDLTLAIRVVGSLAEAVEHIHTYGSGHTDYSVENSGQSSRSDRRSLGCSDAAGGRRRAFRV